MARYTESGEGGECRRVPFKQRRCACCSEQATNRGGGKTQAAAHVAECAMVRRPCRARPACPVVVKVWVKGRCRVPSNCPSHHVMRARGR